MKTAHIRWRNLFIPTTLEICVIEVIDGVDRRVATYDLVTLDCKNFGMFSDKPPVYEWKSLLDKSVTGTHPDLQTAKREAVMHVLEFQKHLNQSLTNLVNTQKYGYSFEKF